ncbi:anti-sigma factor [Tsukamurella sp. NPDC003166]|uniref:anti-sigma factor n=1 Tax=Tsukamurella sp. NPDC003166 TaxID=3154444 RepID=UPI0033B4720B
MNPQHSDAEFLDLAEVYALHALGDQERAAVESALRAADPEARDEFDARVRATRETMAAQAATYAEEPPAETFENVLSRIADDPRAVPIRHRRGISRRTLRVLAAAAVVVVAVGGGVLVGRELAPDQGRTGSDTEIVLAAPDARTAQARVGDATISFIYSRERNAGVVLMNDVPPPKDGTVYQMWLMDPGGGARSRGTMTQQDVRPTTTAAVVAIDDATSFGISVERPGGAAAPSPDRIVATLPIQPG